MNLTILNTDIQKFISNNLTSDITKLILKGSPFDGVSIQELANQIIAKQKSRKKLATWFGSSNIYYPPKISIEQSSSEITARYKSNIISGNSIVDITGGFGVDSYEFSKQFNSVIYCEINDELYSIVKHNFKELRCKNITTIAGDGIDFLRNTHQGFDCIYIDPSRRNDQKGKVFLLKDCSPNVLDHIDFLFTKSNQILIKNSPILDITSTVNALKYVKEIHIVAVKNEVKEVLFLLEKKHIGTIKVKTINIQKDNIQSFDFTFQTTAVSKYSKPLTYLYEPNAAILKSGGFHEISKQFDVYKLQQHSHLYTSDKLIDFPGRSFIIQNTLPFNNKSLKKILLENKANITTRNFPKSVAQIRKETGIKNGGNCYIFLSTDVKNELISIVCKKENN